MKKTNFYIGTNTGLFSTAQGFLMGLCFLFCVGSAHAQDYAWAKSMGSTGTDLGLAIAVDGSGNVYTTGYFSGTVDFDPSAATANLTSAGLADLFVTKFDASGNYVWAKNMGGASSGAAGTGIAVDGSGNVHITGYFLGTVDFDPSAATANLTSAGSNDIFVCKLSSAGAYTWAVRMGGTGDDQGLAIALDGSGNVHTTGYFLGTVDFDPSAATANLITAGGTDIFVCKLSSAGAYSWAKSMGSTNNDEGKGIALDASGNVHTIGYFQGTVDFDPSASTANLTSAGSSDIFVCKFSSTGTYTWAKSMGGTGQDQGSAIALDGSGNVHTTGSFNGTADFDPSASTANLTSAGSFDIFVCKLSSAGAYTWAKSMGSTGGDYGSAIALDGSSNVYTIGSFQGTVDFDPSASTANLTSAGQGDIFVSKFSSAGAYTWAKGMGGTNYDYVNGIAIDGSSNVHTIGYFQGTADFDPSAATANLTPVGLSDIFVSKLGLAPAAYSVTGTSACSSVTVGLSGSESGVTYQLKRDGTNVGTATSGTGSALSFGSQTTAGTYTVVATRTNSGIALTMTNSPSVYATPTITTSASTAICAGATSFTIPYTATTGTPTTYSISGTGITTVTNGALPATPITVNLSSPASGSSISYTLTVRNANSCTSSNVTGSVTVNALPTITKSASTAICAGATSFTIPYTATTGTPTTYSISGTGITTVTNAALPATPITVNLSSGASGSSISYTLTVRNANGCTSSNVTGSVTVNATPTITTSASAAICAGATSFTIPYTATTGTPTTYSISGTGITTVSNATLPTTPITVNLSSGASGSSISYTLTVRNASGCTSSNVTGSVTVNPIVTPSVIISANPGSAVASGTSVTFLATPTNGGTTPSYQWKKNGSNVGTNQNTYTNAALANGDVITCVLTSNAACLSTTTATSNSITMTVVTCPSGNTLHVNASVSGGTGDGSSWANAYASLSNALAIAHNCSNITTVKVAAGTYKPTKKPFNNGVEMTLDADNNTLTTSDNTFHLRDGLTLQGGYDASGNRNITANVTILSGDFNGDDAVSGSGATLSITGNIENAYHVVLASAASSGGVGVTIDGFTVKGGNANGSAALIINANYLYQGLGGGIFTYHGTNTISNNIFSGNIAGTGGGVSAGNGSNTISNNTFSGNIASNGGGISTGNATVSNNTFLGNYGDFGGGLYSSSGTNTLSNNTFSGNYAGIYGGGIYFQFSTNTLSNNTFSGNSALYVGGGVYVQLCTNTWLNNTLYSNSAANNGGGVFTRAYEYSPDYGANTFTNTIFWNNKKGTANNVAGADYYNEAVYNEDIFDFVYATNTFKNNILQLASSNYATTNTGEYGIGTGASGNRFAQDPYFTEGSNPAGADGIFRTADDGLRLACNSSARDAGTNTGAPSTDILGNTIYNITKDMGAYESQTDCLNTVYTGSSSCEETTLSNVSGNAWFTIYGTTGIIGSINPNGLNLGTLTINIGDPSSVITKSNTKYIGRSINIRSSNYADGATMPSNYTLRLYYKDSELTELNTANGQTTTATQLYMGWQSGGGTTCDWVNYAAVNSGTIINTGITYQDYGIGNNGFSLQFDLNHFTAFAPYTPATVLPVEILSFTGKYIEVQNPATGGTEGGNLLTWQTANEVNNKGFEIERLNGNDWQNIGFLKGNNKASTYQFLDDQTSARFATSPTVYYRLRQIDNDGKETVSKVIALSNASKNRLKIYPSVTSSFLTIETDLVGDFQIFNLLGQQVLNHSTSGRFQTAPTVINVSTLPQGTYVLKAGTEQVKFVKQ